MEYTGKLLSRKEVSERKNVNCYTLYLLCTSLLLIQWKAEDPEAVYSWESYGHEDDDKVYLTCATSSGSFFRYANCCGGKW